ncbi:bone marrow proteoglycan [Dipodomys merriami]|uniref:bone marrow proteoglycan n=1 Tax=Dipodomys merriami TaxID=94247 RepID=UPI0038556B3C
MKLLLLALLVGAVSALHLMRADTPNFKSPLEDKILTREEELPTQEVEDLLSGELMELEEAEGSGSNEISEEEGAVQPFSTLDIANNSFQCPAKENTVELLGIPGCKTCHYILVTAAATFSEARHVCQRCYRGSLVSIHSSISNYQIQCFVQKLNQGQVWIGGWISGSGYCKRFYWVDNSSWNFANWAKCQPSAHGGSCVSMCVQGGRWRTSHCCKRLPFVCSR